MQLGADAEALEPTELRTMFVSTAQVLASVYLRG